MGTNIQCKVFYQDNEKCYDIGDLVKFYESEEESHDNGKAAFCLKERINVSSLAECSMFIKAFMERIKGLNDNEKDNKDDKKNEIDDSKNK